MKKIIYKNPDNSIAIITPSNEALSFASIQAIAEKDVPHNLPYWIVDSSAIPEDRSYRSAWEVSEDMGEPIGFGGESNEFDAELLANWKVEVAQ
jgi:hypothetical protein